MLRLVCRTGMGIVLEGSPIPYQSRGLILRTARDPSTPFLTQLISRRGKREATVYRSFQHKPLSPHHAPHPCVVPGTTSISRILPDCPCSKHNTKARPSPWTARLPLLPPTWTAPSRPTPSRRTGWPSPRSRGSSSLRERGPPRLGQRRTAQTWSVSFYRLKGTWLPFGMWLASNPGGGQQGKNS